MKGCFMALSKYQDSNLQRDEIKDDSPFRQTVGGCEPEMLIPQNNRNKGNNNKSPKIKSKYLLFDPKVPKLYTCTYFSSSNSACTFFYTVVL